MKDFFRKIAEKIGAFFAVNNDVNENTVMGVIVLAYIMVMQAVGVIDTEPELYSWLLFDAAFWGLNLAKK